MRELITRFEWRGNVDKKKTKSHLSIYTFVCLSDVKLLIKIVKINNVLTGINRFKEEIIYAYVYNYFKTRWDAVWRLVAKRVTIFVLEHQLTVKMRERLCSHSWKDHNFIFIFRTQHWLLGGYVAYATPSTQTYPRTFMRIVNDKDFCCCVVNVTKVSCEIQSEGIWYASKMVEFPQTK